MPTVVYCKAVFAVLIFSSQRRPSEITFSLNSLISLISLLVWVQSSPKASHPLLYTILLILNMSWVQIAPNSTLHVLGSPTIHPPSVTNIGRMVLLIFRRFKDRYFFVLYLREYLSITAKPNLSGYEDKQELTCSQSQQVDAPLLQGSLQ